MNIKPQDQPKSEKPQKRRQKRPPKKITEKYLHNAGLYYLQRFAASSHHFREVMLRKIKKSCMHHKEQNFEDCAALVDALVLKFQKTGLLDDESYTKAMVNSQRRQGKSTKAIMAKLKAKGLPSTLIKKEVQRHDEEYNDDPAKAELHAALIFARKKKIGPFKINEKHTDEKILGMLARNGFNYDIAKRILEIELEEAEALMCY